MPHNLEGKTVRLVLQVEQPFGQVQVSSPVTAGKIDLLLRPIDDVDRADVSAYLLDMLQDLAYEAHVAADPQPPRNYFHHDALHVFEGIVNQAGSLLDVYTHGDLIIVRFGPESHDYFSVPLAALLRSGDGFGNSSLYEAGQMVSFKRSL